MLQSTTATTVVETSSTGPFDTGGDVLVSFYDPEDDGESIVRGLDRAETEALVHRAVVRAVLDEEGR